MKLTGQEQRVLEYMRKNNGINPLESWRTCGVYRLSAVILRLKQNGFNIESKLFPVENKFGEVSHFAFYELKEDV